MNPTLECAQYYISQGWAVLPLHTIKDGQCTCLGKTKDCKPGKHPYTPLVRHGSKDATTDPEMIKNWFSGGYDVNIGVCAGKASGLVLLDIDPDHGGDDSLKNFPEIPRTLVVATGGGGTHYYFKHPDDVDIANSAGALGDGLDVRGHHGYVVAPPSRHISGKEYRWIISPGGGVEPAICPKWIYKLNGQKKRSRDGKLGEPITEGNRNTKLLSIAGAMRRQGCENDEIIEAILKVNENRCKPPLDEQEVERIARSASGYKTGVESPIQAAKNNKPWLLTDLRNAERLVHHFGHNIRYCGEWGKWLIWNGSRWAVDENGEIFRYAYKTIEKLWDECKVATDSDVQSRISKWAISSQTRTRIDGMIYLARSLSGVAVSPEFLNKDLMLLNCENGTVDLKDGKLKPHDPTNMITRMCPVKYEKKSSCLLWKKFLGRIMNNNEVLIGYLQRLCGYWLTAQVIEQILVILYGLGANGKTVFCETIMSIMGDYAAESPPDLLVAGGNDHPTEIADLCGRRLVVASETEQGSRLKIQLVKRLTGNTKLKARFMRQDFFEFDRTHKLILCTNNKPAIDEKTNAIWRRVKLIPFSIIIPEKEQDKDLLNKLRAEWPGILYWMVQGCLAWQQSGLKEPDEVIEATWEYRRNQDPLADFFEECCKFDSFAITPVSSLKKRYENWATERGGECRLSATDFNEELRKKGCEYNTKYWGGETQKCWTGLDLRGQE